MSKVSDTKVSDKPATTAKRGTAKPVAASLAAEPVAAEPVAPEPVADKPAAAPPVAAKPASPKPAAKPAVEPAALPAAAVAPPPEASPTPVSPPEPAAAATQATSPAPIAAPAEIVEPVAAAPAEPSEAKTVSKPSQPLTLMVSQMTPTPTFKGYDEIAAFGKANIDALLQANSVFTKGVEEFSKEFISLTQAQMESAAAAAKAILAAKTLKDVVELNAEFTKSHFDTMMANSTKLGELGAKLATDSFAPIRARVTAAVEKAAKPAA